MNWLLVSDYVDSTGAADEEPARAIILNLAWPVYAFDFPDTVGCFLASPERVRRHRGYIGRVDAVGA